VPPQQAKLLGIAATKTKKSLRLQEQNALATAKKKDKLEAQKIAVNRRKKMRVGASEDCFAAEERKVGGTIKE
jgi:hypothetical protein